MNNFAVFILSNRRPDSVVTYATLRKHGYTGKIYVLVDDMDPTIEGYEKNFPGEVVIFDKKASAKLFDRGDNFDDFRSTNYARNALFEIAKSMNLKHFVQLDDDYTSFAYRFDREFFYCHKPHRKLDKLFETLIEFFERSGAQCIAISQGGDFIGGEHGTNPYTKQVQLLRKLMNFFLCSTERPFKFLGRLNEDVNTYARLGSTGKLFFTLNQVSLEQKQTQSNSGGMTSAYKDAGTYVKSFYTVMFQPSSAKVRVLATQNQRIHHAVHWEFTAPKILRQELKKA